MQTLTEAAMCTLTIVMPQSQMARCFLTNHYYAKQANHIPLGWSLNRQSFVVLKQVQGAQHIGRPEK